MIHVLRLHLFGPTTLEWAAGRPSAPAHLQPKQLGLLAYLAMAARDRPPRRDTLLAMFWPELDEGAARHALSQALSVLRRELGPGFVDGKWRGAVTLSREALWCDAVAFRSALREGRDEAALELHVGPFLEGLHVSEVPDFERWVEEERRALEREAAGAALRLTERSAGAHRWSEARHWARHALTLAPYDESAWRHLFRALAASGECAAALAEFDRLRKRLEQDLGVAPSPETLRLIETIRLRPADDASAAAVPVPPAPVRQLRTPDPPPTATLSPTRSQVALLPTQRPVLRWHPYALVGTIAALVGVSAGTMLLAFDRRAPSLDERVYVIAPFAVSDADTALARLAQAMPVLLADRLNPPNRAGVPPAPSLTAAGLDATSARAVLRRARSAGAGRAVTGVLGTAPSGIIVAATLLDATTGAARAYASVDGTAADLDALLDRLAATLLGQDAGEAEPRLGFLTQAPLPAVHRYLEGQALLRAAQPQRALDAFVAALEIDSTFASTALAASLAAGAGAGPWQRRGVEAAWRSRHLLARLDRQFVTATLGPHYPSPSSFSEQLAAWEALVPAARGYAYEYDVLFAYGDFLFHYGALLGIEDAYERARRAFERAHRIDPRLRRALQHIADLAFIERDTARLRHAVGQLLSRDDAAPDAWLPHWMLAVATADPATLARMPPDFDAAATFNLPQQAGVALDQADRAAARWAASARTLDDAVEQARLRWLLALNRGRPALAEASLDSVAMLTATLPHLARVAAAGDRTAVLAALYWSGDSAAVEARVARLAARVRRPAATSPADRLNWQRDACVLEEWQIAHGRFDTLEHTLTQLDTTRAEPALCARVLRTLAAGARAAPEARALLDALDALARTVPPGWLEWYLHGNLLIARMYEQQGRVMEADAAVRRRGSLHVPFQQYLSTYVREEGRLALARADTARAVRAWQHYLGLRDAPEPALLPERDHIAHLLAAITVKH